MFKKDNRESGNDSPEELQDTIIALGVTVEGDFKSKGNIIIEGTVLGSVKTNNDLKVGEKAKIAASVAANNAYVAGEIQGSVKIIDKLELSSSAHIYGDIQAKILIINAGAVLNGKCTMPNGEPSQIKQVKKVKKEEDDSKEKENN